MGENPESRGRAHALKPHTEGNALPQTDFPKAVGKAPHHKWGCPYTQGTQRLETGPKETKQNQKVMGEIQIKATPG